MRKLETRAAKLLTAAIIAVGVSAIPLAGGASVSQPTKTVAHVVQPNTLRTITCVKGTIVKKITGLAPKCPIGYSPVYATYVFNASYSGSISILWNSSGPSKASIVGVGKGTNFGLVNVNGTGTGTATSQVVPVLGTGVLGGYLQSLHLKFNTHTNATAASSSAPTVVVLTGTAAVTSGTGKFLYAFGTLTVSGAFNIKSTSGSEKDTFSATLKGIVKVQK